MLQKLENAYLAILRFVVIAVAGLLLIMVVILGLNSLKALQSEPAATETTHVVSEQDLIQSITAKPGVQQQQAPKASNDMAAKDPNAVFYERAATAMTNFIKSLDKNAQNIDNAEFIAYAKQTAESLGEPKLTAEYAKNFADAMEKTLKDPSVIKVAQTTSVQHVIQKVVGDFFQQFKANVEQEKAQRATKQQEYLVKKAEGMQSLYIAAGAFASFLMIVFLSVIIRIERNLRNLEKRPEVAA
ncbi:hypothetical protein R0381_001540 [Jeongeupia wiesaeckerbachi]|uniref:hypothetical protein n=1 Tax=Jeongeupia wiesaeckerbachi TaxID=3051218 RepID=UPI003D803900